MSETSLNPKVAASLPSIPRRPSAKPSPSSFRTTSARCRWSTTAGHLVGIFSERDVLRVIHSRGEGFGRLRVADLMTGHPVTCHLDDDVNDVMGKMSERHIAKVPVLSDSELVGIVSVGDVIKVLYDKVHTENQHLISYIHGAV